MVCVRKVFVFFLPQNSTDVKLQFGLFNDCWLCRRCAEIKVMQLLSDEAISAILSFDFGKRVLDCVHTAICWLFQLARFWSFRTFVADSSL